MSKKDLPEYLQGCRYIGYGIFQPKSGEWYQEQVEGDQIVGFQLIGSGQPWGYKVEYQNLSG